MFFPRRFYNINTTPRRWFSPDVEKNGGKEVEEEDDVKSDDLTDDLKKSDDLEKSKSATSKKLPDPIKANERRLKTLGAKNARQAMRELIESNDYPLDVNDDGEEDVNLTISNLLKKVKTEKKDEIEEDPKLASDRKKLKEQSLALEKRELEMELTYSIPAAQVVKVRSVRAEFLDQYDLKKNKKSGAVEVYENGDLLEDETTGEPLEIDKVMEKFLKENPHLLLVDSSLRRGGSKNGKQVGADNGSKKTLDEKMGSIIDAHLGRI